MNNKFESEEASNWGHDVSKAT